MRLILIEDGLKDLLAESLYDSVISYVNQWNPRTETPIEVVERKGSHIKSKAHSVTFYKGILTRPWTFRLVFGQLQLLFVLKELRDFINKHLKIYTFRTE